MSQFAFPQADGPSNSGDRTGETGRENLSRLQRDRRERRRAVISCPIRVRCIDFATGAADEICTTVDVSRNGILFEASNPSFQRGMEVAVTLPYTESLGVPKSEQFGSVARVSALAHGKFAVAIAFGLSAISPVAHAAAKLTGEIQWGYKSKKPLILLVEADLSARDSLKGYLSTQGYRVIAVGGAAEGREVLNAVTPALVIAEIEGEGLPGFDLCVYVKETPRLNHIPVMLTTHSAYPTDYSNAHSLGAVVCIAKPFRQERLGHVVRLLVPLTAAEMSSERSHSRSGTFRPNTRRQAGKLPDR